MAFVIATVKPIKMPKAAIIAAVTATLAQSKEFRIVLRIISAVNAPFKAVTSAPSSKRPNATACLTNASLASLIVDSSVNAKFSLPIKLTAATIRFSSFVKLLYKVLTSANPA